MSVSGSSLNTVEDSWSDSYVGNAWTDTENCFYWVARIINQRTPWQLPLFEGFSFRERTKALIKEEKQHWQRVTKPQQHFDLVLMRHTGSAKNIHHIGIWTEANGGAVVHAVDSDFIDLDSLLELQLRGFEIKRVMRHN